MGRWRPYTDIKPVRAHIAKLRSASVGYRQIALAAGTSSGHIREIAATSSRSAGRPPMARIRAELAERILAIQGGPVSASPNAKVVATGTQRRIQALIAIGWPVPELAARLHRSPKRVDTILRAARVTIRTTRTIERLYNTLWDQRPPSESPAQREGVTAARQRAAGGHWAPPLAWDDIDTDPQPQPQLDTICGEDSVDEIAVDRAVHGDHIKLANLTPAEQVEVIRRLTSLGRSIREIAERLATTERTVARRRAAAGHQVA